jgi:hypothetical protein
VNKRTKFLLGIGVIAALVVGWQVAAFAVHDTGAFELEGNAKNGLAGDPAGDDWDNVCHQVLGNDCSTTNNTNGATAVDWVAEPTLKSSIFTGGGSKDPNDISQWAWKNASDTDLTEKGSVPDKDNLLHSFAARYSLQPSATCPSSTPPAPPGPTCELLYFGSDRYDNSGDAQQGFWFFQNEITLGSNKVGGGTGFNGVHKNGDLLIISDFSNGGTVSTISVYSWDTSVSGNLKLLASSDNAKCTTVGSADQFCGIVNPGTITMPWSFTDKSGTTGNQALNGEFYEGGINLSALGLGDRCFSSVASETRSSTSTTATLKDFTLGKFGNCQSGTATHPVLANGSAIPADGVAPETEVKDSATITVSGVTNWTGKLKFSLCKIDAAPAQQTCASGGSPVGPVDGIDVTNTTQQPILSEAVNTVANPLAPGKYCFRADFSGDTAAHVPASSDSSATECFTVTQPTTVTTAQRWIPQDTATVTPAGTAGTVSFQLYSGDKCATGTELGSPLTDSTPTNGVYETDNTTIIAETTVSWKASFDATNANDSTGVCETATVSFDNNGPDVP